MLLISYETRSRKFVFGLDPGADQGERLAHIGSGLRQVYDHVYKGAPTDVYPDAEERVHVFIAGIGSFFMRAFGEFKADWSVFCFDHIMRGGEFYAELSGYDADLGSNKRFIDRAWEIQKEIQETGFQITPGLKPEWAHLIGTSYDLSKEQIEENRRRLVSNVDRAGISLA
jgi:hypothetical protein